MINHFGNLFRSCNAQRDIWFLINHFSPHNTIFSVCFVPWENLKIPWQFLFFYSQKNVLIHICIHLHSIFLHRLFFIVPNSHTSNFTSNLHAYSKLLKSIPRKLSLRTENTGSQEEENHTFSIHPVQSPW